MKQLFINGNASTLFFSEKSSFDDIFEWVQERLFLDKTNLFNLNEQHSCSVNNSFNSSIVISGDEDRVVITIEEITPIM
jgi:hypothetical protein